MEPRKIVPLRIAIHYGAAGFEYPEFSALPPGTMRGLPWERFVDVCGGWVYDKPSGFGEADDYNPDPDVYFGLIAAPADFASACVDRFPGRCAVLTAAELAAYWDRAHAHTEDQRVDARVLDGVRALYGDPAGLDLDGDGVPDGVKKALDPDHPAPGIVANVRKTWDRFAARQNLVIDADTVSALRARLAAG